MLCARDGGKRSQAHKSSRPVTKKCQLATTRAHAYAELLLDKSAAGWIASTLQPLATPNARPSQGAVRRLRGRPDDEDTAGQPQRSSKAASADLRAGRGTDKSYKQGLPQTYDALDRCPKSPKSTKRCARLRRQ